MSRLVPTADTKTRTTKRQASPGTPEFRRRIRRKLKPA